MRQASTVSTSRPSTVKWKMRGSFSHFWPATVERLRVAPDVELLGQPVTFDAGPTPGLTNAFLRTGWGVLLELVDWGGGG